MLLPVQPGRMIRPEGRGEPGGKTAMVIEAILAVLSSNLTSAAIKTFEILRGPALLRALVLRALELDAKKDGQSLVYPSGTPGAASPGELDARLPEGLGDLKGPLGVWLWLPDVSGSSVNAELEQLEHSSVDLSDHLDGLLFIHDLALTEAQAKRVKNYLGGQLAGAELQIWGRDEIRALLERNKDELGTFLTELALAPLRAELEGPGPDWRSQAKDHLNRLAKIYRNEGVVLALGAGVSAEMGIPNWDELVSALFVSLITKQLTGSTDEAQALALAYAARHLGNESPLLSARYLRKGFEEGKAGDPQAFRRELASVLYGHLIKDRQPPRLLKELAKLCMPMRTGAKVHCIITYNFDDLLEQVLSEKDVPCRSIYSALHHADEMELPVFHAHGFLPRDVDGFDEGEEGMLAFSEEGYHQLFKDPYHWTNVVQLQAFQQQTCVFVGLSLTDPNLRRLLEYAATSPDRPRHFAFMKRTSVEDLLKASRKNPSDEPAVRQDAADKFLRVHHKLQELVYQDLGLEVVWFETFEEMPDAVASLRPKPRT